MPALDRPRRGYAELLRGAQPLVGVCYCGPVNAVGMIVIPHRAVAHRQRGYERGAACVFLSGRRRRHAVQLAAVRPYVDRYPRVVYYWLVCC